MPNLIKEELNVSSFTEAPLQITKTAYVDAPIDAVWKIVADHQGMTTWMPMIRQVHLTQANEQGEWGEGCERQCQFGPDLLNEKIVHWNPPYGYAYMIADMHLVNDHLGHISLSPEGKGTRIEWRQYFNPNGNAVKRFVAKKIMMPQVMSRALKNLNKKVA